MPSAPPPPLLLQDAYSSLPGRRARDLTVLARARIANLWMRLGGCAVVAFLAAAAVGDIAPFLWLAGLAPVLWVERFGYLRLAAACAAGAAPARPLWLAAWILAQSAYVGVLASYLWFAPYAHGETLAVILLLASLGNTAATLRGSVLLTAAAALPSMALLALLPLASFAFGAFHNPLDLLPAVGAALFAGFSVSLWRTLRASDEAQVQAEAAALRERKAAAAASTAKSEAIQRMQAELRTPMTALISAAEHLRRAAVSPEARAHIGALAQAGEVLRLVLEDLGDLDRLENGAVRIEPQLCDPRDLVRGVIGAFRVAAHDKGLELFLDIGADVPALVEIDARRVRQILFNLVANAVKYTHSGGVRLRLQVQAMETRDRVRLGFVVADTGAGMSRSQLALAMGQGRPKGNGTGPGLGLSISLRLARLMGGRIGAKSTLGEGSMFSLVLEAPFVKSASASAA